MVWGWFFMAQRGARRGKIRRLARRYGLLGGHAPLAALLVLACLAGGAGAIWHVQSSAMTIERAADGGVEVSDEGEVDDEQAGAEQGDAEGAEEEPAQRCFVHVDGAVGSPGIVELTGEDLRVYDAVMAAGGLLDEADTTAVNLAEPLADGAKIHIPSEGEATEQQAVPTAGQAETSGATGTEGASVLVNINTASSEELQTLSGVGEATAAAIIQDRDQNGPFATIEDLMRVSGIGEKKFAKVQDQICV